jgi:ABC-type lipoprotein export system ATPase subunit
MTGTAASGSPATGSPAASAATVVALRAIEKSFATGGETRRVLAGADLSVRAGEIVALAGRSGSGKTTSLTIVAGWEAPDAGTVTVLDEAVPPAARRWHELAILPQSLGLLDELTVGENVALPLRLGRLPDAQDPMEVMARLGVDHLAARYPREVSLGEQQRSALARAAVVRPRVLLADEPTMHQNRGWAESLMVVLADLAGSGTACVLATHDAVALQAADRVLEVREGRLHPR